MIINQQSVILTIMALINCTIASVAPVFIYSIARYPSFRLWIVSLVEDGDGVAHKQDAKDAVILFFAFTFAWLLIDIILLVILFDIKDGTILIASVTVIMGGLFGISQFKK